MPENYTNSEILDETEKIEEAEEEMAEEVEESASESVDLSRGTAYERETIINFNNAEKTASYYTLNYGKRQMLLQLAEEYPNDVKIVAQRDDMVEATLPKSWIKVRPPRKMTEEARQKMIERGKALAAKNFHKKKEKSV